MYFRVPFANSGTRATIDLTNPANGPISYTYGYGSDYSLPRSTDPAALNVERLEFNELMYQTTSALKQYQEFSAPDFITTADNGGSPFSYSAGVRVRYSSNFYISLTNSNTELPSNPAAWGLLRSDYAYVGFANVFTAIQTISVNGTPLIVNSANSTANKITLQDNAVTRGYIGASGTLAVHAALAAGTVVGGWDVSGNLVPATTATYDLGTTSLVYRNAIANRFTVMGSTAPTNGIYLPSANVVGIAVNSGLVASFTSSGMNSTVIGATTPAAGTFTTLAGTVITASTNFAGNLTGNVTGNVSGSSGSTTGNAATATALQNARTIGGVSFDGTGNITVASATGGFTVSGGNLALGANSITMTGSIGVTGSRVTKGWFTDLEVTNAIVGSITGNAATATNATTAASCSGNAATATALQNARTIGGVSFNGTANITVASATGGFTVSGGDLAIGANNITISGSIGVTGTRVTKLWATDAEFTNAPTLGGVAATGSGGLARATSPTFITPTLGVATATSLAVTGAAAPANGLFLASANVPAIAANGVQAFQVTGSASAVNLLRAVATVTGSSPQLSFVGTDTNVGGDYITQGTGVHRFYTLAGAVLQVQINHVASAVNYIQLQGAVTGAGPAFIATGTDANVPMQLVAKGSGNQFQFYVNTGGGLGFAITGAVSTVNYITLVATAAGTAPSLSWANGSDTNIDAILVAKGTGRATCLGSYTNTAAATTAVHIDSSGRFFRLSSQLKYKDDVENFEESRALHFIDRIRPVWYRPNNHSEPEKNGWGYFGLIAEEVAALEPRFASWGYETLTGKNGPTLGKDLVPIGVHYDLIALAHIVQTKAKFKQVDSEIEQLKAQIADALERLNALEKPKKK